MTPLEHAITHYIDARTEAEHWQGICSDRMKTHGRRHPEVLDMLAHRRLSRKCLRFARCQLEDALKEWCPYQNALADYERTHVPPTAQVFANLARLVVQ
jgi:hypothetical protein